jgi:phage major head subunit gpT-like protein
MAGTAKRLGYRNVEGAYWLALEETTAASWLRLIASLFETDQPQEDYPWLADAPRIEKWEGQRTRQQLADYGVVLVNDKYEGTIEVELDDLDRDKTGQIDIRAGELGDKAAALPQRILTELIEAGASGLAYDGVAFFADSHSVGASGTIDNNLGASAAAPAAPTVAEMSTAILASIEAMMGFGDTAGDPRNEFATEFTVMVPTKYMAATIGALSNEFSAASTSNTLIAAQRDIRINRIVNPRLTASNNIFYTFRSDARIRPFIWQDELSEFRTLGRDSDFAFMNDSILFGAKRKGAGGYGRFELAARTTFT